MIMMDSEMNMKMVVMILMANAYHAFSLILEK